MNARRFTSTALASLCALAGALAFCPAPGEAASHHNYLFQFKEVPAVGPHNEAIAVPGPLTGSNAMAVDGGEVYIAEGQAQSRLDKFDAATGAFVAQFPQVPPPMEYIDQGLAIGHATGEAEVYVGADELVEGRPFGRVTIYDASGKLQSVWDGKATSSKGFGCFECGGTGDVAVDNSSGLLGDWAVNDVFVADPINKTVDVFEPETGKGEQKPIAELTGISPSEPFVTRPVQVAVSAVNGDVLVLEEGRGVDIFKPGVLPGQYEFVSKFALPASSLNKLDASDGEGDIYIAGGSGVFEFNAAGELQGQITPQAAPNSNWGSEIAYPYSVTADPVSHHVYVGTYSGSSEFPAAPVLVFGPNIVLPDVATGPASSVAPTSATLNGTVDLDQAGAATCGFDWGTSSSLLQEFAPCSGKVEAEGKVPVSGLLSKLQPDTTYYYRPEATNANGTNSESLVEHFTTPGPGLRAESVSDVASTSATFDATINPNKHPASYYFQYGKSAAYESEVPLAPGAFLGSGEADVEVDRHIQGLAAGTTYHYRLVVVSELEVEPGVVRPVAFPDADRTFRTQIAGGGLVLPDGRQWELVSPPDKHGALIEPIRGAGGIPQASMAGGMMTYLTTTPTESNPAGYSLGVQVLSTRGSGGGWSSQDISLPHAIPTDVSIGQGEEYRAFSQDLSTSLPESFGLFSSLAPDVFPLDTGRTPYLRHNLTCWTTPASCYEPLATAAPGYADVPPGTNLNGGGGLTGAVQYVDGTPDLTHVVLNSSVALTATGGSLYEWSSGKPPAEELQSIGVLPASEGGTVVNGSLGFSNASMRHALSNDGSRAVWGYTLPGARQLYLRDMVKGETVRLDAVQGGSGGGSPPAAGFQFASSDDSKVFFTDTQRLTSNSNATIGKPDLYECEISEVAGKLKCALSDLTPGSPGQAAAVRGGPLGGSEDGSYLYFVASGALSSGENARHEKAALGGDNLYMLHYDGSTAKWEAPQLVGVLAGDGPEGEDSPDWGRGEVNLVTQPTRVSPDGRYLAFMSSRSLTGYDNHDANSGKADEEVFLFDAHGSRLVCASCNPTGAKPTGVRALIQGGGRIIEQSGVWGNADEWLAASIPGWTPYELQGTSYQSRYLSNEGRLFFDSSDGLVPQDINNNEDVYEYEPAGIGSCSASSSTFSEGSGGCVGLLSSGTSAFESAFLDASESGSDVFFMTAEALVPGDVDTAYDVYDAHACTSESPCLSTPVPSPECITADACRSAPTPQPAAFGAPASATFSGAGNVTPSAAGPAAQSRSKPLTRAQKLARALAQCRKRDGARRGRRVVCERQARKRYGARQSRKANATKRGKG